jgi:hypothetical protein
MKIANGTLLTCQKSDTSPIKIVGAQKLGFRTFGVLRRRVISLSRTLQRLGAPAKRHSEDSIVRSARQSNGGDYSFFHLLASDDD